MSKCEIRRATISDADIVYLIDQEYLFERYSFDMIKTSLQNENYFNIILSVDGVDIGYLSATSICDECELLKVVIRKDCRGMGYGRELINALKNHCKAVGINKIYLEVCVDNEIAKRLYEGYGFTLAGVRKGYYDGVDGEIYWCEINGEENKL